MILSAATLSLVSGLCQLVYSTCLSGDTIPSIPHIYTSLVLWKLIYIPQMNNHELQLTLCSGGIHISHICYTVHMIIHTYSFPKTAISSKS